MNYLAHIYLSFGQEDVLIGNFISDFITNKEKSTFRRNPQHGISLHHKIDNFTDNHPIVIQVNDLIRPSQGKYTPVVTDIYFDHFLIKNWPQYSDSHLPVFTGQVYTVLNKHIEIYPDNLKALVPIMIRDNFLLACENEPRLRKTFQRVANRAKYSNNFDKAYDDLMANYSTIETHFEQFFIELKQMASAYVLI